MALPEIPYVLECLRYDPNDGGLYWRERPATHFRKQSDCNRWNARYAGMRAGNLRRNGYWMIRVNTTGIMAHRIAWALSYGEWPQGQIDHINHSPADNRIKNLRVVTNIENGRNQSLKSNNKSGFTGVYWDKRNAKWAAFIRIGGKGRALGRYPNIEDAVTARKGAERQYNFHPNHGI